MDADLASAALMFAEVVDSASFTAAARRLGVSKSTLSSRVRGLEAQLQAQLLTRTTRAIAITDEGRVFLESVVRMREHWHDARSALEHRGQTAMGVLRVTAPTTMSDAVVSPIVCGMLEAYPELKVDLLPDDRNVDLVRNNVDVAIRVGELADSSLVARRVGQEQGWLAVQRGSPWDSALAGTDLEKIETLRRMPFAGLVYAAPELTLSSRTTQPSARLKPRYRASAGGSSALLSLVLQGAGVAVLTDSMMLLGGRRLRAVLPDYTVDTYPLWLVRPARRYPPPRVLEFVERLEARLTTPIFEPRGDES